MQFFLINNLTPIPENLSGKSDSSCPITLWEAELQSTAITRADFDDVRIDLNINEAGWGSSEL